MLKLNILLLIAIFLMAVNFTFAQDYIPPSDDELWQWWESLSKEDQISELKKLDIIEHSKPEIIHPAYTALLLKNGDLIMEPAEPKMNIKIHYLEYDVELKTYKISGFYEPAKKKFKDYILPIVFGIASGTIGTAIAEEAKGWQYGISAAQGFAWGIILSFSK